LGFAVALGFFLLAIAWIGVPAIAVLWLIGLVRFRERCDRKFVWARLLFTACILLNNMWGFLYELKSHGWISDMTLRNLNDSDPHQLVLGTAFICLCLSMVVGFRSKGPGVVWLYIVQFVVFMLSSALWLLYLATLLS
jgi:hypothetical protein